MTVAGDVWVGRVVVLQDKDKSGYIEGSEMRELLTEILKVEPTEEQLASAMSSLITASDEVCSACLI